MGRREESDQRRKSRQLLYTDTSSFPSNQNGKMLSLVSCVPKGKNAIISDYSLMHENVLDIDPVCELLTSPEQGQQQRVETVKFSIKQVYKGQISTLKR